ncbi:MAG: hypothetical protein PUJ35_08700 [Ruminococcus bromii]|nr:hypothetical protein [Ruminococcus bromii]
MRKIKTFAAMALAAALLCAGVLPASATSVDVKEGENASASTSISIVKENPAPVFTVGIPAEITITSADPAQLTFTMGEESLNAIPDGMKVSVSIADAGYTGVTGKFALYSADADAEATYGVYGSKYSTRPSDAYAIGDLLVSFYGNEKITDGQASIGRVIKADDFDGIAAGTYNGTLTFSIDVRNQ